MNLDERLRTLGIASDYGIARGLQRFSDATALVDVEPNIVGLMQRLAPNSARDWRAMKQAARTDGISLLMVSGFRSIERQAQLIERKLAAGTTLEEALTQLAAPGYSQHHTGRAIDIATIGCRPLTAAFADTPAFAWLARHGGEFGFQLPYGRDNRFGFAYEPWHWSQIPD
jgi:D-alanyl-D-alanine carboxypeptidase